MRLAALAALSAYVVFAPPALAGKLDVLYTFTDGPDSAFPSDLILANGLLYGNSFQSADGRCINNVCGTLFSVNPISGAETNVYTYTQQHGLPYDPGALVYEYGRLYGVADAGGKQHGSIFSIDPSTGKEHVVYTFASTNLFLPQGLAVHGKTLYTTAKVDSQTIFDSYVVSIGPGSRTENVVADLGAAGVYGVTSSVFLGFQGSGAFGTSSVAGANVTGAIFQLNLTSGTATNIYNFAPSNTADGTYPTGNIVVTKDAIYGVTTNGGTAGQQGDGTIYKLDRATNTETILHAFTGPDGSEPSSGLVLMHGQLYGTASYGGGGSCNCGTIFRLDPATSQFTLLHTFKPNEGIHPGGPLAAGDGILYGTSGSAPDSCGPTGCGEVFSFKP